MKYFPGLAFTHVWIIKKYALNKVNLNEYLLLKALTYEFNFKYGPNAKPTEVSSCGVSVSISKLQIIKKEPSSFSNVI